MKTTFFFVFLLLVILKLTSQTFQTNPITKSGLPEYFTFDRLLNNQKNISMSHRLLDSASTISTTSTFTFFIASSLSSACPIKNDFSFTRNPCSPFTFTFSTASTLYNSITWDFGDGNNANGSSIISHTYSTAGNYQVTMIQDYGTCADTVRKNITVDSQNDNTTILTNDTTICFGELVTLSAASAGTVVVTWDNGVIDGVPFAPAAVGINTYTALSSDGTDCGFSVDIDVLDALAIN